jgi:transcriptional regulator with XRE-family HTH domain
VSEAILPDVLDFGALLKDWRQHRRVSQLGLSSLSGISQRHISFLETGRSRPSRATVLALSESLDIPLRERNALLQSAGFAAAYSERPLDGSRTAVFQSALQATLAHHEPYPALVLDGRWNLVMANDGALRFFARFVDLGNALGAIGAPQHFQIARLCLHEAGLKPYIVNWQELAWSFLARARRALLINPRDRYLPVLIEEISHHPEAPEEWRQPDWTSVPDPALTMVMEKDGERYALFTMMAHFGAAQSVTLEELSVETFFPADATTRAHLEALAGA